MTTAIVKKPRKSALKLPYPARQTVCGAFGRDKDAMKRADAAKAVKNA